MMIVIIAVAIWGGIASVALALAWQAMGTDALLMAPLGGSSAVLLLAVSVAFIRTDYYGHYWKQSHSKSR
jgi:hypothetical protein